MTHQPIRGVIAPMVTPFDDATRIATGLLTAHAKRLLELGCAGLAPFGTTGEALSLGLGERIEGLEALVEAGVPAARMIPGTGLTSLADTARLTRHAVALGCNAAMVLPPFYFKNVADAGLVAYYTQLIEEVADDRLKIVLYHIPQVAGVGLPVAVVRTLREAFPEQIIGIKDSSGDWDNLASLMAIEGLAVWPGAELPLIEALGLGAMGAITASANLNPGPIAEVIRLWDAGQHDAARAMQETVRRFRIALQSEPMIPGIKHVIATATGEARWARLRAPLVPLSEQAGAALADRLEAELGFRWAA